MGARGLRCGHTAGPLPEAQPSPCPPALALLSHCFPTASDLLSAGMKTREAEEQPTDGEKEVQGCAGVTGRAIFPCCAAHPQCSSAQPCAALLPGGSHSPGLHLRSSHLPSEGHTCPSRRYTVSNIPLESVLN